MSKQVSSALFRSTQILCLAMVMGGSTLLAKPAYAFYPPPCETTECPSTGPGAWEAVTDAVIAALAALEEDMYYDGLYVKDALTRLANQHSNNRQNTLKSLNSMGDSTAANVMSPVMGAVRAESATEIMPARSVCGVQSVGSQYQQVSLSTRAAVGAAETVNTGILTNAPGTAGANGQLAYFSARFGNRMSKYCNSTTVNAPGAITCTATIGPDRDLFPYDSIFKQGNFATANDYTAAKDVVLNLLGDTVKDPVRGPALLRQDGQTANINRYSEQAKANLASSVLLSMVERRHDTGSGTEADKMSSASYTDDAVKKLAEIGAGQTDGQNLDNVGAMIGESTRSIFVLRDYLEQWAAIEAVSLAIDVKQNSAGGGSIATRPIGN